MHRRRDILRTTVGLGWLMLTKGSLAASQSRDLAALNATGLDGSVRTLSPTNLKELAGNLKGALILPGNERYEQRRRLFFYPSLDSRPAFIVQAADPADVAAAVNFARHHQLLMSIKGGGHSDFGMSSRDGTMMLDLGLIRGVRIDPSARRAFVAGATPTGLLDLEAGAHLLAVPAGGDPSVGIGGIALGGGIGKLSRTYGLTLDSIRSIDVMGADGRLRHASASENPDLFWAMRGGGSNFGIATGLELQLNPVPEQVLAGTISFPLSELAQVAKAYGEFSAAAPDNIYVELLATLRADAATSLVQFNICFTGDPADSDRLLHPLRKSGRILREDISAMSYPLAQRAEDHSKARAPGAGGPRDRFFRSGFIDQLGAPLADVLAENLRPDPDRHMALLMLHGGGEIARRDPRSTAFANRTMLFDMIFAATWPRGKPGHAAHAERLWSRLHPFTNGFYVNEMAGGVGPSEVAKNYGANAGRLAAIKAEWDPGNLFRLNANILPRAR